jgi:hypothetical protein
MQAAEALVARLGALAGAEARIAWHPGLRRDRGLNGYTSPRRPDELHVEPDSDRELVLRAAAHEWIHSLELRGMVRLDPIASTDGRCSNLALSQGEAIANQAARLGPAAVALPEQLVAALFDHTGQVPACFARTRRSSR